MGSSKTEANKRCHPSSGGRSSRAPRPNASEALPQTDELHCRARSTRELRPA